MKEFIKTEKYGTLMIERILFESYYPLIFTCVDDKKQLFLSVCCKNNHTGCKWLIAKTDSESIVKLLEDKITIRSIFIDAKDRFTVDYIDSKYIFNDTDNDFAEDSIYLPKKDSFLYSDEGEFEEEIEYYSSYNSNIYNPDSYRVLNGKMDKNINELDSAIDIFNLVSSSINNIYFQNFIMKTLVEISQQIIKPETNIDLYNKNAIKNYYFDIKLCSDNNTQSVLIPDENNTNAA